MPALFVFLLKVNVALIVFCLGYFFVLRHLTFYTLNRIYLITAIVFSSVYPLIDINDFALRHEQIARPVQIAIISWKTPAENLVKPLLDYWYWAETIFWLGAAVFAIRLLVQLVSLFKLYKRSTPGVIQNHDVRIVDADISPFSFWQSIFINPENLKPGDLKSVLQHEQVHVKEWHTIDVLLTEISVIFYWFNPGVWLMKKAVRENIEFITDRKILQQGANTKEYQYSLLNVSVTATTSTGVINHFNFSTLKKRIKMMNAKRSSKANLTRYAFLVPAVVVLLFVFSLSKAEIVKKTKVAYKTIAASVKSLTPVAEVKIAPVAKPVAKVKKAAPVLLKDTVKKETSGQIHTIVINGDKTDVPFAFYPKEDGIDTGKHNRRTISVITRKRAGNDSTETYMINGKVVSKEEFKKLTPEDIATINVFGDRLNLRKVTGIRLNSNTLNPTGRLTIKLDSNKNFSYNTNSNTSSNSNIVITKELAAKNRVKLNDVRYSYNLYDGQNINNFTERLIIIDGKEADEKALRKLPAADIDNVKVIDSPEMMEKYGEKAKKGVLFINTKKAKK